MPMIAASRYHDFSCAHRAVGDKGKCGNIHGHNYRVTFHVTGEPDDLGRVIDFSEINTKLCQWIEENWDHKLLLWHEDPLVTEWSNSSLPPSWRGVVDASIVIVSFNTSSEMMASFLVQLGKRVLHPSVCLWKVVVSETRKCGAEASI